MMLRQAAAQAFTPGTLPAEIRGIVVGRKADAVFFLHTARIGTRRHADRKSPGVPLELARYAIHYADGQRIEIPILAEVDVEDYHQKTPAIIPGAQIAWIQRGSTERSTILPSTSSKIRVARDAISRWS